VAEEVVRHAPCPVLTIHAQEDGQPEAPPFRSIAVPIDFSGHSRIALALAHDWAALYGARIDLIHVIENDLRPAFYRTKASSIHEAETEVEDRARTHLEQLNREVGGEAVEARFHVLSGRAAARIVDFAEENRSDLIVMSTHGLTGLNRFLIGSVTEKVVRHAECPVLTVKAFGKPLVEGLSDASSTEHGSK
ncbi:MAG TPA: universal stress protein, partial [Rhodothermales bacterium]|nr:universal stress protein [Rhodothermales bacterium]